VLSFDITHCNSLPAKSNDTVKEFSCLPFLDNSNVIENDYQPIANIGSRVNRVNWRNVSTSSTEYENIPMNPIRENIPMNPIHEDALINANDALGNQIQDIDSEEHIYSEIDDNDNFRGSMPSRSPAPEEIYDEISNNANLNSRTQCNIHNRFQLHLERHPTNLVGHQATNLVV
jgi:hypothetical protein